jgi:uncharacterized protein (DUF924 family)
VKTMTNAILDLWFGEDLQTPRVVVERAKCWFAADPSFDDQIRSRFGDLPDRARNGELVDWRSEARSTLALVLVLDQFPRNLNRGTVESFAYDSAALEVARDAISRELDSRLYPVEAAFLYLPFEHAEDSQCQRESVTLFRKLAERAPEGLVELFDSYLGYAERHHAVIEQFGRFPHRNSLLGRKSTPEEVEYLESGGETFSSADSEAQ